MPGAGVVILTVALGSLLLGATVSLAQSNDAHYKFVTTQLPDVSVRPTLANGQIGFVVYDGHVHLNGVYNGEGGQSHRARVRNFGNIQLYDCSPTNGTPQPGYCNYQLDMREGKFVTVGESSTLGYRVDHEVYPHRFYDSVLVNRFRVQRLNSQSTIQVRIQQIPGMDSGDFALESTNEFVMSNVVYRQECSRTVKMEQSTVQTYGQTVCVTFQSIPEYLEITPDTMAKEFVFYTVFSMVAQHGVRQIEILAGLVAGEEHALHVKEMDLLWDRYGITVEANEDLDRAIKASAFYLFSSLPAHNVDNNVARLPFYGLAPAGLGRGGEVEREYQGHSFWDTEIWMYPSILLMDPINALKVLQYRSVVADGARLNAVKNGFEGVQFPWESAFTGTEVTPECCPEVVEYQHHITADIAFAIRQYFYTTGDTDWFGADACEMVLETARFWRSRARYNNGTDLYDIRNAMGPDEDHHDVTNNAFTNVMAAHNLFLGEFASCFCSQHAQSTDEGKDFLRIGRGMTLLYDAQGDFHPQYDGYVDGTLIKQADTVLLIYPLQYPMNEATKANNLRKYSQVTRENGPAMTWAIHTIGHLELGQEQEARSMFEKSYKQYLRAPFNVWSENGNNEAGAGNFITGAGGFLQTLINGYAGVRLHQDRLEIRNVRPPPESNVLYLPTIEYRKVLFSLTIRSNNIVIKFKTAGHTGVRLVINNAEADICLNCEYSAMELTIQQTANQEFNGCSLRPTTLGIKVADQTDGAAVLQSTSVAFASLILSYLLSKMF
ncbi:protein-glucosylgalactosylhydroxylysine glucosidase-like [Anopheles cruzii]|uniref:protein-glucosylgalactosylhydroxylysine glucosidase-like n=1 Tax=Anopheles cruzii TaxID=68878 RepID=UPI0022EC7A6C|nr:protein-glucosylgalactosylhydroxylysine glucosidase-like [Anopheles cruzii]